MRTASCLICVHREDRSSGVFCTIFEESILNERAAAEDCQMYLDDDAAH